MRIVPMVLECVKTLRSTEMFSVVSPRVSDFQYFFSQLTSTCFAHSTPSELHSELGSNDFVEALLVDPTEEDEK